MSGLGNASAMSSRRFSWCSFLIWWVETSLCAVMWWYSTYIVYFEIKHNRIFLWLYVYPEGLIYDTASGVSSSASSYCNTWEFSEVFGLSLFSIWSAYRVTVRTHWDHTSSPKRYKCLQSRGRGWEWSKVSTAENVAGPLWKDSCAKAVNILFQRQGNISKLSPLLPKVVFFLPEQGHL